MLDAASEAERTCTSSIPRDRGYRVSDKTSELSVLIVRSADAGSIADRACGEGVVSIQRSLDGMLPLLLNMLYLIDTADVWRLRTNGVCRELDA